MYEISVDIKTNKLCDRMLLNIRIVATPSIMPYNLQHSQKHSKTKFSNSKRLEWEITVDKIFSANKNISSLPEPTKINYIKNY